MGVSPGEVLSYIGIAGAIGALLAFILRKAVVESTKNTWEEHAKALIERLDLAESDVDRLRSKVAALEEANTYLARVASGAEAVAALTSQIVTMHDQHMNKLGEILNLIKDQFGLERLLGVLKEHQHGEGENKGESK